MDDLLKFWGKAGSDSLGSLKWAPLAYHLLDTGHVARLLVENWVPESVFRKIASDSGISAKLLEEVTVFLAAAHDLGKATPAFQAKRLRESSAGHLHARMELQGIFPELTSVTSDDSASLPHNWASHVIVRRWLSEEHAWLLREANTLCMPLSGHHGYFPSASEVGVAKNSLYLGTGKWRVFQAQFIDLILNEFSIGFQHSSPFRLSPAAQVFITGLIVASDWIASDENLFSLFADGEALDFRTDHEARARNAIGKLDLSFPWEPHPATEDAGTKLRTRFGFTSGARANNTQIELDRLTRTNPEPELYIVEAPTGVGKSEAALLGAENLAANFSLAGLTFALPTQATTNAMLDRVLSWLEKIDGLGDTRLKDIQLAHGKARFNARFQAVPFGDRLVDVSDEAVAVAGGITQNRWAGRSKLKLIANFTVATIDQVLVASLATRHNVLRHLGIARKVLVLDEVHAADTYMQQYLYLVIEWAAAYAVPVICLSATLPTGTRDDLLDAYNRGKRKNLSGEAAPASRLDKIQSKQSVVAARESAKPKSALLPVRYPAITFTDRGGVKSVPIPPDVEPRRILVEMRNLTDEEICDDIVRNTAGCGGRVLIIRNTVRSAIDLFRRLEADLPGSVMLNHSRFTTNHRAENDASLLAWFGKSATDQPNELKVVVATQVAEQSLDIDADLLYTDIAPSDLLIQRIGRLHRHAHRIRPQGFGIPRCVILGVSTGQHGVPEIEKKSQRVYDLSLLLNTAVELETITACGRALHIPEDVQKVVGNTYDRLPETSNPLLKERMSEARDTYMRKQEIKKRNAQSTRIPHPSENGPVWGFSGGTDDQSSEEKIVAKVRDTLESLEVILILRDQDGYRFPESRSTPNNILALDLALTKEQESYLSQSTVRVPQYVIGSNKLDEFPGQLENFYIEEWQTAADIKGQLFLVLDPNQPIQLGDYLLTYDRKYGLEIRR